MGCIWFLCFVQPFRASVHVHTLITISLITQGQPWDGYVLGSGAPKDCLENPSLMDFLLKLPYLCRVLFT